MNTAEETKELAPWTANAPNRPYTTLSSTFCLPSPQLNAQTTLLTPDMLEPRIIPL
jgi:hypothetical protein